MSPPVKLIPLGTPPPDSDILHMLQTFLEKAKSGDILGISIVAHMRGGGGAFGSVTYSRHTLCGLLEEQKLRMLLEADDLEEDK